MHELSIVQSLLSKVEDEARLRGALSVARVELRLGEASGVEPALLRSAFETFRERTLCSSAVLDVTTVPVRWRCRDCGEVLAKGGPLRCGICGGAGTIDRGDEILLERLELEMPDV